MKKNVLIKIGLLLAGWLFSFAFTKLWIVSSFLGLLPVFYFNAKENKKTSFSNGWFFGFGLGVALFFWMLNGVAHYTGAKASLGLLVVLVSAVFVGLYFGFLAWGTSFFYQIKSKSTRELLFKHLAIAAFWAGAEFLLSQCLTAFPLHNIRIGFPLVTSMYFVQLSGLGGLSLLTFFTVLCNVLLSRYVVTKEKIHLLETVGVFVSFGIVSMFILNDYEPTSLPSFKVAIVSDNTDPTVKWDAENGNILAEKYIDLSSQAVATRPDFILWPETALPWTYEKDDDLLHAILAQTKKHQVTNVIGMNREEATNKNLYNAVFYLNNKQDVKGIYNKQVLLKGIEMPIGKLLVPFLNQEGFVLSEGTSSQPISTAFGKAANLVCNEVVLEQEAANQVKQGANFIFNLSNDGWFKDNYISDLHFYYARYQAVANRKDVCVANNCGINGIITSSGVLLQQNKAITSSLVSGIITPNTNLSFFTRYTLFFPFVFLGIIGCYLFLFRKTINN